MTMRTEFASRDEMAAYLREQFLLASARCADISPIRGGATEAEKRLDAVEPGRYAFTRNYLDGLVTRLSPFIRHGVLTLDRVRRHALRKVKEPFHASKFVAELAWRDYWQRLYRQFGADALWRDCEPNKTGIRDYADELPSGIEAAGTGLACMDAFARELHETGYLHNHARMWLAAYVVHFRRIRWQAGARWFLRHLLDGDLASNNLSWQWVASTFSHKPYFFNRENLEKYTAGRYCRDCAAAAACPFDASYEVLENRLFRINEVPER
jgi:deoxyribodipyrimidine photo-lyase